MARRVRTFAVVLMLAAAPANAQSWKTAYETGDIFRALDLLQPLVFEAIAFDRVPERGLDPMAPLYLATYYVNGWRVEKDPVIACALVLTGRTAAEVQGRYPEPMTLALQALEEKTCAVLTSDQRADAMASHGCFNLGLAGQTVHLEGGGWVETTRQTFIVDQAGRRTEVPISMPCAQHVLPLRYRRLVAPAGKSGHPRDIVQVFAWYSTVRNGELRRALMCTMWEVVDGTILSSASETLVDEPGSAWPQRPVPDLVQFDFRYTRGGEVEYHVVNAAGERQKGELRPYDDLIKAARRNSP